MTLIAVLFTSFTLLVIAALVVFKRTFLTTWMIFQAVVWLYLKGARRAAGKE
jgi:hypothetical protein